MTTPTQIRTWGQALDYTWQQKWKRLRSADTNRINSGHVTDYCGRSLPLSRMERAGFWTEFQNELLDEGRNTSTVNRIVSAGTTVLEFSGMAGLHNYKKPKFARLKEGESRLTWFTKDQVKQLAWTAVDVFGRKDLADAIVFSAYTGIRQGELRKLKSEDIDWDLMKVWIGGKPDRITKGGETRAVPIHESLEELIRSRMDNELLFGCDWDSKDQLWYQFKKVRKHVGISEDYVWHTLRHSFGTWLGEVCHPRTIMDLMGHKTIDMVLKYVKATDKATSQAVMAL